MPPRPISLLRCLYAEALGTFALTFVDGGAAMVAQLSPDLNLTARALAAGLVVMSMIFAIGSISGAHINPAVTFSFAVRGVFPWKRVPSYWIAQSAGALLAALSLWAILGKFASLGATHAKQESVSAFACEIVLSFFLVFVILSTSHNSEIRGPEAALPVGATVAFAGLMGKGVSDASMNPARSLGPALVSGDLHELWIYLLAPFLGGALAVAAVFLLHGRPTHDEKEAATGVFAKSSKPRSSDQTSSNQTSSNQASSNEEANS
jgi:aquaporin Z